MTRHRCYSNGNGRCAVCGGVEPPPWPVTIHPDAPNPDADLIDDLARSLAKAWEQTRGLAVCPVSDPVWIDLARTAIEKVRAAR